MKRSWFLLLVAAIFEAPHTSRGVGGVLAVGLVALALVCHSEGK